MSREIARLTSKGLLNPRDARVIERTSLGEHVDYVVRLRSGLSTPKEEGTFPCKTKEEALKIGEDWCTNGIKPALPHQPVWDLGDFTRIPVEELKEVYWVFPSPASGHKRSAKIYKAPTKHVAYPYLLIIKDGDQLTGNYPFAVSGTAKDAANLWFNEGKQPEQLTLKGVREARRIAMLEQIVPAKQPKEQPSHTPANASFFWELRGIADPTCFHFASKHLAIESLEVTYADEVAEQKFDIKWGYQNMSAVIGIKGIGCYTLTLKLAQTIFTTPIHLQRHKDL